MSLKVAGIGLMEGLSVVLKNATRKPITTQYPEERLTVSRRTRAQELVWDPGRCTGCATCAKACPQGNIKIKTSVGEGNRYVVEIFENDEGRCIFCGLCVEACPYEALFFGRSYERSKYRRGELVADIDEMTAADKERSAYYRPDLYDELPEQTLLIYRRHKRFI